ncbi:hypothetical protein ACSVH5_07500 [Flavobacterium sp. RSSA_27]|uniref:hypothetical protein n=1 Tax=Flavobacterium sp. RSSA_27 TaxID=3447667 RepID=UPI003F363501
MKKMIFTAMAVLAFSAVSVANTIEVKEAGEIVSMEVVVLEDPCKDDQDAAVAECKANGCSDSEAFWFGLKAWGDCMKELSIKPA